MNKISKPEWWAYLAIIGFLIIGMYFLKLWRKNINPKDSITDRVYGEWSYLITGTTFIVAGIMFLVITIYQACTGMFAK